MVRKIANRVFIEPEKNCYTIKLCKSIHDYSELLENLKDYSELFYILLDEDEKYYIVTLIPKDKSLTESDVEEFLWLLSSASVK